LCACTHISNLVVKSPPDFNPDLPINQYAIEIENQQRIVLNETDANKRAEAYYKLAQLYLSYKNPKRNYQKCYESLKKLILLNETFHKKYEVKNMMAFLKDIDDLYLIKKTNKQNLNNLKIETGHLNTQNRELMGKLKKNRKDNIRLIRENVELKRLIEGIKKIDLEIEMKRKTYK
jgi:hypothetical protein